MTLGLALLSWSGARMMLEYSPRVPEDNPRPQQGKVVERRRRSREDCRIKMIGKTRKASGQVFSLQVLLSDDSEERVFAIVKCSPFAIDECT